MQHNNSNCKWSQQSSSANQEVTESSSSAIVKYVIGRQKVYTIHD